MIKQFIHFIACCILPIVVTGVAFAEAEIEQTDLRLIITGNTVEGQLIESNDSYQMYFHPLGNLLRKDGKGNVSKGRWRLEQDNKFLCLAFATEICYRVNARDEGQFDLYDSKGVKAQTIDRVILGNPARLDALTGNS